MASKLHGVEVDIKIIKRKGDPIISENDSEKGYKYSEQQLTSENRNCAGNKHAVNKFHINNNNSINTKSQMPSKDSLSGTSEYLSMIYRS